MKSKSVIVLFLGNSILTDDKIGLILGEKLKKKLENLGYKVEILEKTGLELIDYLSGYDLAVIVDSIKTGKYPTGSILLFKNTDLEETTLFKSPHYSGVFDSIKLMEVLNLNPPRETYVLAIEVENPYIVSESLSPNLQAIIPFLVKKVFKKILEVTENCFKK
ncbi:MAG: hypothetical protein DRJ44_01915 [Thermoprotei archaeon]|nr:MAG: hypothetical protein DRJ44_01915 [Thermoprotei archaeon]